MKQVKRVRSLIVLSTALITSSVTTAQEWRWWERPYVGADFQMRHMAYKEGYGDNLLIHHSPQGNIYVGLKFNSRLGIEIGQEMTITSSITRTFTTGDMVAGALIDASTSPAVFKSKFKIKGQHVDLVGFYTPDERYPEIQLLGSIGVSVLKGTVERRTLQLSSLPRFSVRTLSTHKSVLRLGGGVQYMFTEHLGTRVTMSWVNTGKMIILANDGVPGTITPEIKPENSTVYGLGVIWAF